MTVLTPNRRGLGYVPDTPDDRDLIFKHDDGATLPSTGGLEASELPPIWNQSTIGSCTAHGSLRGFVAEYMQQGLTLPALPPRIPGDGNPAPFSRLEQYYNTRSLEGPVEGDNGAQVRDAIKSLAKFGVAPESEYPYNVNNVDKKPTTALESDSRANMAIKYHRIVVTDSNYITPIQTALHNKHVVVFGFQVPLYFEQPDGNIEWDPASGEPLPVPDADYENWIGGHCVAATGYDFTGKSGDGKFYTIDNSWDTSWGMEGRFNMDAEWFNPRLGFANDIWVITKDS